MLLSCQSPDYRTDKERRTKMINQKKLSCIAAVLSVISILGTGSVQAEDATWQTPCMDAPYDHTYQDEMRFIAVNEVVEDQLTYYVADVQIKDFSGFHTVATGELAPLSKLIDGTDAVLAINGDDYATHKYGVIIRNGELLRTHDTTRHMLTVDTKGDLSLIVDRKANKPDLLAKQLVEAGIWQAFEFGPALVENGEPLSFPRTFDLISTKNSRKEPRTAIGQIGPLHYIILVVDGRQPGHSEGISLQNLQQLMLQYGAQTAINLDGGGSAEMWFMGEVLNSPSDGHERRISDVLYF